MYYKLKSMSQVEGLDGIKEDIIIYAMQHLALKFSLSRATYGKGDYIKG